MRLIGKQLLADFKRKHTDATSQIDAWIAEVEAATWRTTHDIKKRFSSASFLRDRQVVFNIKGNKYRLHIQVNYEFQLVRVKNAGTHEEYNNWKF